MSDPNVPPPTVQIVKKDFFQTKVGKIVLAIIVALILFVILVISLNYFDIVSLSGLSFLPKKHPVDLGTAVSISLIPTNFGFKAGELTLDCPVESSFCKSQKLINLDKKDTVSYNNGVVASDAVAYKAASGSSVLNLTQIKSLENIAVLENKKTNKKYFYESVVSKDNSSCYTISYTLPSDANFTNILDLKTFLEEKKVATLGSQTFKEVGEDVNVLIQVRNTPMDPGVPCSLIKKSPDFFKNF